MNSSNASLHCRLEWRPSRWLPASLALLGILAMVSTWLSALPVWSCVIGSIAIAAWCAYRLRLEMQRTPVQITWAGGDAPVVVEREVIEHAVVERGMVERGGRSDEYRFVTLSFRAGLVVLCVADERGRKSRWIWWPDTLGARGRRALRLAASVPREPLLTQPTLPIAPR